MTRLPIPRKLPLVVLLVATLVVAVGAAAVAAPKADRSGGGKGDSQVTLTVNPDPAVSFEDHYVVSGCGMAPEMLTDINIRMPHATLFFSVETDAAGCFSFTRLADRVGGYTIDAYQVLKGKRASHVATGQLEVVPAG